MNFRIRVQGGQIPDPTLLELLAFCGPFERLGKVQIPEEHKIPIHSMHTVCKDPFAFLARKLACRGKYTYVGHLVQNQIGQYLMERKSGMNMIEKAFATSIPTCFPASMDLLSTAVWNGMNGTRSSRAKLRICC